MDPTDSWSWEDVWGGEGWMWHPPGILLVEIDMIDMFIQLF